MKCLALAHHALAHDWSNISLATIANAEWLVHSALCVIDSSQQTNATGSCVLFVKGISAWIIIILIQLVLNKPWQNPNFLSLSIVPDRKIGKRYRIPGVSILESDVGFWII